VKKRRILVADDKPSDLQFMIDTVTSDTFELITATRPEQVEQILRTQDIDLAILDLRLETGRKNDHRGAEIARKEAPGVPKIITTIDPKVQLRPVIEVLRSYPVSFVFKKDGPGALLNAVKLALIPRVFVAHGHRGKDEVARFLEHLGLESEILRENLTVEGMLDGLERLVLKSDAAIVALMADDEAATRTNPKDRKTRARQNVIFEWGYAIAALGRSRVIALYEPGVEIPSNYEGIRRFNMDRDGGWKKDVEDALRVAGIDVDFYSRAKRRPPGV
jgi:CheY-like chemotaxis protein